MHLAAYLLVLVSQGPLAQIDALAKARDADGMIAYAADSLKSKEAPFKFLKQNGVYEVGRFGWHAFELSAPGGKRYVVFSTPLTSEDIGEQLFEWDGSKLTRYVPETDSMGVTIRRQTLEVWFDVPNQSVRVNDTVQLKKEAAAGSSFVIRMSPNYKVSEISDASGSAVTFVQAGGVVALKTPADENPTIRLKYSAVVNQRRYAGSINPTEAMLTNDYWYPMIARRPCAYDLTVHSPKGWIAVGQGEELSVQEAGSERVTRYRMDLPVTYWSLSAAPYNTAFVTINGRKYGGWSLSLTEDQLKIQAELFRPIIEFYSTFAPYPFSRWGAVDSPNYGGGALEAYSFATYGSGWLPDDDAHEPAHTWFGGIINNTYLKSLWNESFADFCMGLYQREGAIGNRTEKRLAFVSDAMSNPSFNVAPMSNAGADLGPVASSLGYGKGAMVLQVLEQELGTQTMIKTLQQWIADQPKGVPGEWEDYEKAAEKASGRNLKTFFDQWVRRPGYPDFDVKSIAWSQGNLSGNVEFKGNPYDLRCEVMLQFANGKRQFHTVLIDAGSGQIGKFTLESKQKPALVSFDPWRRLLRRYGNDENPVQISTSFRGMRRFTDPKHPDWLEGAGPRTTVAALPANLNGIFVVGSPESLPALKPLCAKVGFKVSKNRLTYSGTTIDLDKGGAMAVVDLVGGGKCIIGLGKTKANPSPGRAGLALFDEYGRFLRGATEPKTAGFLTFKL